jgi:hypothetical protein
MSTWFVFTLAVLATHRLTVLLADDRIAKDIRDLPDTRSMLWYGVRCFRCVSVWMAALTALFLCWTATIELKWYVITVLALSSAAICIERLTTCPSK